MRMPSPPARLFSSAGARVVSCLRATRRASLAPSFTLTQTRVHLHWPTFTGPLRYASARWQHRFYYMFGFLALVFIILVVTCAEITIVLCYLHLCAEEYRWWWRAFLTSGAVAG